MQKVMNRLLVNYEVLGKGKRNLLILHGWKSSLTDWAEVARRLGDRYRVWLVDLPGFGGTAKPRDDWGIYEYADFTAKFMQSLGLKKAVVLGHSFGGRVAILLASRYQQLVTGLILVDAAGMEIKGVKAKMYKSITWALRWLPQEWKNKLGSRDYREAGEMRRMFVKIVNQSLRNELADITTPTLIVWGEKDRELSLGEAQMLHEGIKGSTLRIVWGAGHRPHQEKLEDFMGILAEEGV